MLSISKVAVFLIYLLPVQKYLSSLVGLGFPGAQNVIFIAFEFAWVAVFILFGSLSKKFWLVYLFICFAVLVLIINMTINFGGINDIVSYLSGFRRLALPFVSMFIFYKLIQQKNGLSRLNNALINLYWFVLVFQLFDFAAMQVSDVYRSAIISVSNVAGDLSEVPLDSHIVLFGWQLKRSFGVLLNFQGSGLLLLLLFLYKIHLKSTPKPAEVAIMTLGVIAGGSLQNLGLLIFLPVLLFGTQQFVRYLLAIGLITFLIIGVPYLSSNPLPYFGTVYIFEYGVLLYNVLFDMLSDLSHFSKLLFGFGNLRLSSGAWEVGTFGLELGDIGFFRLFLESGLLMFLFWLLLCLQLGKYRVNSKHIDCLRHNALLAIPFISILSLMHYPVLFLPINMTIYMLSLALINELKSNTVHRNWELGQILRNKSKFIGEKQFGHL